MSATPDTSEAVKRVLMNAYGYLPKDLLSLAFEADRQELERQGFAIVKRGELPEWMELGFERYGNLDMVHNQLEMGEKLYRLKTEGESTESGG